MQIRIQTEVFENFWTFWGEALLIFQKYFISTNFFELDQKSTIEKNLQFKVPLGLFLKESLSKMQLSQVLNCFRPFQRKHGVV